MSKITEQRLRDLLTRLCALVVSTYLSDERPPDWQTVNELALEIEAELDHESEETFRLSATSNVPPLPGTGMDLHRIVHGIKRSLCIVPW